MKAWTRILTACLLVSCFAMGCASTNTDFTYYHPGMDSPQLASLLEKVSAIEEKGFENIAMQTLAKNNLSTHHLVVVREEEPLHYHAEHDGWALVIKGEADFLLGKEWMVLRPGSSVYIPRGVRHRAIRRGPETVAAFVIFTPPYDGSDMVLVREE